MELDLKKNLNAKLLSEEDADSGSPLSRNETVTKELPWWKCCAKLNNKTVLFIVCCLFACFASAEMAGAFVSLFYLQSTAVSFTKTLFHLDLTSRRWEVRWPYLVTQPHPVWM